jgi:hypothetical protein
MCYVMCNYVLSQQYSNAGYGVCTYGITWHVFINVTIIQKPFVGGNRTIRVSISFLLWYTD